MTWRFNKIGFDLADGARVTGWTFQILWGRLGEDDWRHGLTLTHTRDHGKVAKS